jgi:glycosyltransferase involved in cell wall biosynthesis
LEIVGAFAASSEPDPIKMTHRILIITTKQPSTNPRMRKAAEALAREGHTVHVLFAHGVSWAVQLDEEIFQNSPCTWQKIGGDRIHQRLRYFFSRVGRKMWELFGNVKRAHCRSYGAYIREGIKWQPDLVIAHNPGALGPLTELGARLKVPILFDAEDFHRGEFDPEVSSNQSKDVAKLEHSCIPKLNAATGASPLIVKAYERLFPEISWTTVNNAFPNTLMQSEPLQHSGPLKLVWFSQVVGLDRGLAEFLRGMALAPDIPIEFTIIGTASDGLKSTLHSKIRSNHHQIQFKGPFPERELFREIGSHEIGLALEIPKTVNRAICRTNKLYTYPLCGVHMLVSKTEAQIDFIQEFPDAGELIDLEQPQSIANALNEAYHNRSALLQKRNAAWELGRTTLNWERESGALIEMVNLIFAGR